MPEDDASGGDTANWGPWALVLIVGGVGAVALARELLRGSRGDESDDAA